MTANTLGDTIDNGVLFTYRFTREFCASDADDWTIAGVSQVKVNKFLVKSDE